MELPNSYRPYLLPAGILVLVQFLFSSYAVLGASTFHNGTSPAVFALLRDVVALGCFVPALLLSRPPRLIPAPEHWGFFFLLALLGVWGSQLMSALTISCLSAPLYSLMKPCVPVVTLLVAVLMGSQRFSIASRSSQLLVAAVTLSVAGAATIVGASFSDRESPQPALGALYLSIYLFFSGTFPVLQKRMLSKFDYSPLFLVTWAYGLGTLFILSSVIVLAPPAKAWRVDVSGALALLFSGVMCSFFNYTAMAWINDRVNSVFVMSFYPLQSAFTPILSAMFLDEKILPSDIGGGLVVIAGLACCVAAQVIEGGGDHGGGSSAPFLGTDETETDKAAPPPPYQLLIAPEAAAMGSSAVL